MDAIASVAPAVAMIGAFACTIGGGWLIAARRDPRKGWLIIVMAVVLVGNVAIWTI